MRRRGFTLVELLVVITIIGILTGLFLGALSLSAQSAREARTKAMIARLNTAVLTRWESYRTRRVPMGWPSPVTDPTAYPDQYAIVNLAATRWPGLVPASGWPTALQRAASSNALASRARLEVLREIMRLEMPQCWDDVTTPDAAIQAALSPTTTPPNPWLPSLSRAYQRRYLSLSSPPSTDNERAECLYLIVTMGAIESDGESLDQFRSMDVGDVDRDGMPEFLDGWGNPIAWLRWPTAFVSDLQPDPAQPDPITFAASHHDPFDAANVDQPSSTGTPRGYKLTPLIFSGGPDGLLDITRLDPTVPGAFRCDPYAVQPSGQASGSIDSLYTGAEAGYADNIHNHHLGSLTK